MSGASRRHAIFWLVAKTIGAWTPVGKRARGPARAGVPLKGFPVDVEGSLAPSTFPSNPKQT